MIGGSLATTGGAMCNPDASRAYRFLQPRYKNYLKAYVYALRYTIAVSQLGGVKVEDLTEETSMLIDLVDGGVEGSSARS
jgi:hypothetical protein